MPIVLHQAKQYLYKILNQLYFIKYDVVGLLVCMYLFVNVVQ